jgi:hypothetical protein
LQVTNALLWQENAEINVAKTLSELHARGVVV